MNFLSTCKSFVIFIPVAIVIALVGCASVPPTAEPAESDTSQTDDGATESTDASQTDNESTQSTDEATSDTYEVRPWDNPYESIEPELCPPNEEDVEPPTFKDEPEAVERQDGTVVLVQQGLFVNPQGELFNIKIEGQDINAVQRYAQEMAVCFDQILASNNINATADPEISPTSNPQLHQDILQAHPENLIITIEFVGNGGIDKDLIQEIVSQYPPEDWLDQVRERDPDFQSTAELMERLQDDFVVDFIIHPSIDQGREHNYPIVCDSSVFANIEVTFGGGGVTGTLLRNFGDLDSKSVQKGGIEVETLSSESPWYSYYDLGVTGDQDGSVYQVSGRWYYPYDAAAPEGGWDCW